LAKRGGVSIGRFARGERELTARRSRAAHLVRPSRSGGCIVEDAMAAFRDSIGIVWVVFWVYWLLSATTAKRGSGAGLRRAPGRLLVVGAAVLLAIFKANTLEVRSEALMGLGAAMLLAGLALAVSARLFLGRNWGMPMTLKDEPELVTSGPYRYVRHPIYSGLLLALLGTAIATNLYWLIIAGAGAIYFVHSATVEERLMRATFPTAYESYRKRTKMLIPFVL
jgi:protein-S-isoprenylcysteine O-methyltransferase Ste14